MVCKEDSTMIQLNSIERTSTTKLILNFLIDGEKINIDVDISSFRFNFDESFGNFIQFMDISEDFSTAMKKYFNGKDNNFPVVFKSLISSSHLEIIKALQSGQDASVVFSKYIKGDENCP